ncbi:LPXTG-motif cell wall anchor domain-containing protein [Actinokineospora alba]|uniref:LPXTG-motif cell wall anchor domain-containing protein n=1 Tax=Actinokineospora alba TaxID=504798 RepID=A0A1H0VYS6_9PSEU|nr:LPXTG cell wall anchor domain-containing protein [Actinokineospora alba]TDP67099.1 LPXTG-motif cell wall-anchored protein [Actinokineospora alba]SDJ46854.1 LPXTG-motif cell wall anchor domain-containing protein [Actinokineospora alba]SDP83378.1 LPXTG-motif cell wall anchor domain-containing protein [Actinokineospora alba]
MLTTVTRVVLAAAVGLTMALTASPAMAQEQPAPPVAEEPTEAEPPRPLLSAVAFCAEKVANLDVYVLDTREEPYSITLQGVGVNYNETKPTALHAVKDQHHVLFEGLAPGQYTVRAGGNQPSDDVDVMVKDCAEVEPAKGELSVEVECKAGWGIVTFVVANPTSGKTEQYTLSTSEYGISYETLTLPDGMFLRITENGFDDGEYFATLSGPNLKDPITKEFTIACAAENAPKLSAFANCDGKDDLNSPAPLYVDVTNPNRTAVDYTIKVGGAERVVKVGPGANGFVELDTLPAGVHRVTVSGSDGTVTKTEVAVDDCSGVKVDEDGLQIQTRCVDGKSDVTFRFFDIGGDYPVKRTFGVDGTDLFDSTIEFEGEGPYLWSRHTGELADGEYTARLTGAGLTTVEKFTVKCADQPTTTTAPSTTGPAPSTTPAPQGGTAPAVDDTLPVTGAAVGTMVALGLAALGLGGFLVITARRKRSAK